MSEPICRLATEEDYPAVVEMYTRLDALMRRMGMTLPSPNDVGQAWLESFQRTLGRFSFLHVAEINGELVGFTLSVIKRVPPHRGGVIVGEITDMWIDPPARRTRVGEQIARVAIQLLRDQGVHSVEARFLMKNDPVWRLAESLGFHLEIRTARLLWEDYVEEDA